MSLKLKAITGLILLYMLPQAWKLLLKLPAFLSRYGVQITMLLGLTLVSASFVLWRLK